MRIYVGNLSFQTTEDGLRALFEQYGEVTDVAIMMDRQTGRSRGFGFVTMAQAEDGATVIETLDETDFEGRTLRVNEAKPRPERGGGGRRW